MKLETQRFMGGNQLVSRLAVQVGSIDRAKGILIKRGDMKPDGKTLTAKGMKRNAMTAGERAVDRAAKASGKPKSDYKYNPLTNRATLKK
jgi:hypothetical protein